MTFITLFTDESSWLASDKRVFAAEEQTHLIGLVEQMQHLSDLKKQHIDEFDKRVAEAEARGFEAGRVEGLKLSQNECLRQCSELQENYRKLQSDTQTAVAELALSVVRKIAGNIAPEAWLAAQAREATVELSSSEQGVRLRVATSNAEGVQRELQNRGFVNGDRSLPDIDIIADENAMENTCILETSFGSIDIDLDTQLDTLGRLLTSHDETLDVNRPDVSHG